MHKLHLTSFKLHFVKTMNLGVMIVGMPGSRFSDSDTHFKDFFSHKLMNRPTQVQVLLFITINTNLVKVRKALKLDTFPMSKQFYKT